MSKVKTNILIFILSVASLYFIYTSLNEPLSIASKELSRFKWTDLVLSLGLLVITMLIKAVVYKIIFKHYDSNEKPAYTDLRVMDSYLLSQIIRYIPGKIVGITAQSIKLTGSVSAGNVWASNFLQYIVTNYNAVILIICIVTALAYDKYILIYTGLFLSFTIHILLNNWLKLLKIIKVTKVKLSTSLNWQFKKTLSIWGLLQLEWLFFLAGVALLTPDASITTQALILGLLYSFSSIAASLTVVMPAGILIRESIFIWISSKFGYEADVLLFLGIMLRIVLSLADILAYIIFYQFRFLYERYKK